jgi:DNA-directed RNA polymerase specialized sigma24 family protein
MENLVLRTSGEVNQKDLEIFWDFREQWQNRSLTNEHVVMVKVKKWAKRIAYRYDDSQRADDLEQSCLLALVKSNYQGKARLDTFIVNILLHENIAEWRRNGGQRLTEFPEEMQDESCREIMNGVLKRISDDRLMEKLLNTESELKRSVVLIIVRSEHLIGRKRIAELASKQLGRKVTRYEVEVALEQLRDNLEGPWFSTELKGQAGWKVEPRG